MITSEKGAEEYGPQVGIAADAGGAVTNVLFNAESFMTLLSVFGATPSVAKKTLMAIKYRSVEWGASFIIAFFCIT